MAPPVESLVRGTAGGAGDRPTARVEARDPRPRRSRTSTGRPSCVGEHLDASARPARSTRRADEHARERAARRGRATSSGASNESRWRPYALRRTVTSMAPNDSWSGRPSSTSRASRIMPAHVPNTGRPSAQQLGERLAQSRRVEQLAHRGGLAARAGSARRARRGRSGVRTSTASTPSASSTSRCSRNAPCSARIADLHDLEASSSRRRSPLTSPGRRA